MSAPTRCQVCNQVPEYGRLHLLRDLWLCAECFRTEEHGPHEKIEGPPWKASIKASPEVIRELQDPDKLREFERIANEEFLKLVAEDAERAALSGYPPENCQECGTPFNNAETPKSGKCAACDPEAPPWMES